MHFSTVAAAATAFAVTALAAPPSYYTPPSNSTAANSTYPSYTAGGSDQPSYTSQPGQPYTSSPASYGQPSKPVYGQPDQPVYGQPGQPGNSQPSPPQSTANPPSNTPPAANGLSLTQKLFIADTAVDRFALLPNDTSFVFDFSNPALKGKGGKAGDVIAANRKTFPALVGTGAGMAVGFLNPCAFNTPHVHPRAAELQLVTQGRLVVAMAPENGVFVDNDPKKGRRVITNTVGTFGMTPFYQGSVHTQFNPDCHPATFVAAFPSEDFGTGQVADELFAFSDDIVSAAFGNAIDGKDVDNFRGKIPVSIANGVKKCLQECNIS